MTREAGLAAAIGRVVAEGNCSGCGGCAALCDQVEMRWDAAGFVRPFIERATSETAAHPELVESFRRVCPGVGITAPTTDRPHRHAVFGAYVSAWQGWAVDPVLRHAGSSAGVLTALAAWLVESGQAHTVLGAASSPRAPSTTVPVRITSRSEALAAAGSRYAPVAVLSALATASPPGAIIAKPCEASAMRGLMSAASPVATAAPVLLSFFCAGTPSQLATRDLVESLGVAPDEVTALHYRGQGWPGRFRVRSTSGSEASLTYEESWGQHLGRALQYRCKICVDGTGADADIAVGDFWRTDARGFPTFESGDGNSVVLARTRRGHDLLRRAAAEGIVHLADVDLDDVERTQPLQSTRKRTLAGRLLGRRLAGHAIPSYRGYRLVALGARSPVRSIRAALGSFIRSARRGS